MQSGECHKISNCFGENANRNTHTVLILSKNSLVNFFWKFCILGRIQYPTLFVPRWVTVYLYVRVLIKLRSRLDYLNDFRGLCKSDPWYFIFFGDQRFSFIDNYHDILGIWSVSSLGSKQRIHC